LEKINASKKSALVALSIDLVQTGLDRGSDSMKSEDFSLWMLAISGMSAAQRCEGLAALEKAAADAGASTKTRGKRTEDALGTTSV
jgi:hypothetical protein